MSIMTTKKLKIGYHVNEINFRGLFKAAVDYLRYNREYHGHEGVIIAPDQKSGRENHYLGEQMMKQNNIRHIRYPSGAAGEPEGFHPHVDRILKNENCDLLYIVKSGGNADPRVSRIVPTLSHGWRGVPLEKEAGPCAAMSQIAGTKGQCNNVVVPTLVEPNNIKEDMREEYGIAPNDTVFGNVGGTQVFHLLITQKAIERMIKSRKDVWFIFLGIQPWKWSFKNPRLMHHKPTADDVKRYKFINTCDCMIHARKQGEMGGGACAEFSISNKPIITADAGRGGVRNMIRKRYAEIYGNDDETKTHVYKDENACFRMLNSFDRNWAKDKNWDCYSQERFPEVAMAKFKEIFLDRYL